MSKAGPHGSCSIAPGFLTWYRISLPQVRNSCDRDLGDVGDLYTFSRSYRHIVFYEMLSISSSSSTFDEF